MSHISYNNETWHSYTLPKKDQKNIWIPWHTLWVLLKSAFFHQKSANFAKSRRKTDIDCILYIISNFFEFYWVFKDCYNKHGYNFDDVSKNSYPRPNMVTTLMVSAKIATLGLRKNKDILKKRLSRHNFCQWRHQ